MKTTRFHLVTRHSSLVTALALAAFTAHAGVKYWDNPDFKAYDVGDYVQDGLVVNYDGIRNAGPDAAHDSNAMTWVNLGAWGNDYDMTRYSLVSSAWQADGSTGSWSSNGFVSAGSSIFYPVDQPWTLPESYTVQTLTDATSSSQGGNIGYVVCPYYDGTAPAGDSTIQDGGLWQRNDWSRFSIGIRKNSFTYRTSLSSSMYLCAGDDMKGRVGIQQDSYKYMTAMLDSKTNAVIFSGIAAPWSENSNARISSTAANSSPWQDGTSGRTKRTFGKGVSIFGHYPRTDELFKGTLNSLRLYNKVLSDEEVAWNRVVDEYRFFGRSADIPVTNVVVATSLSGANGDQPSGAYALDAEGFTFTAPTSRTIDYKRYALDGYTLETWNGSTWVSDGKGTHTGNSVALSDTTTKVRLTWQYSRPEGEGQLSHYDVSDYEQDGLVVHFDGICNQGESAPHSNDATTWVNLGTGGSANNATLTLGTGGGNWTEDGYRFGGNGTKFTVDTAHTWHTNHTVQTLVDAAYADNTASSDGNYVFSAAWNKAAMPVRGGDSTKTVWFHTQGLAHNAMPRVANQDPERFSYATAIHNGTNGTACVFTGTEPPTSGEITTGFLSYESPMAEFTSRTTIGGWGGGTGQFLVGKIKSFRYYSRVLTNDEIAKNRKVDEFRFFGRYVFTNVLVQSTYSYLEGYDKCGPYEVDGSYTFVAPTTVIVDGVTYTNTGYTVETQDGIGWANATHYDGNAYLYNISSGTVRLTWEWKAVNALRTAADYDIDDLSPAGLALHYDGLLNQGVGASRSDSATTWINLGSRPDMNLTRNAATGDTSAWGPKGYSFAGKAKFISASGKQWPTTFSAQVLCDATHEDNGDVDGTEKGHYIAATTWSTFGLVAYGKGRSARFQVQVIGNSQNNPHFVTEEGIGYMTAIHDAKSKTAVVFPGTKAPTSGTASDGYKSFGTFNGIENNQFRLGGWGGANTDGQNLVGTIYTFRYYDRVLTEEEIVRNRNVDAVRYFDALGVTNVFVSVEEDSGITPAETADTAYFVEGSHTFTVTNPPAGIGYRLYVPDGNGGWTRQSFAEGASYTYTTGTSPATVKLEWRLQKPFTLIIK